MTGVWVRGGDLAAHSVGVATSAAGACGAVVGTLTHGKAQPGRGVAAEAGQTERQKPHGAPACTSVSWSTGARTIGAVILVVLGGAVVEEAFDAAQAGAVLHRALSRAQTALSAGPAGRQAAGRAALVALTATAPLTDERMQTQLGLIVRQTFTEGSVRLEFSFRLRSDYRSQTGMRRGQTCEQPLVRRGTRPRHGRAYGTGSAQVGQVSMLLLTLAAGQG